MPERTYIVTYVTADSSQKTEAVVGRNHLDVEQFIKKQGGTVLHLDRDESEPTTGRPLWHLVVSVILFIAIALLVVAYYWFRHR